MDIRVGNYAFYKGKEFKLIYDSSDYTYELASNNSGDTNLGFVKFKENSYRMKVREEDISLAYKIRTFGIYDGHEVELMSKTGESITILTGLYRGAPHQKMIGMGYKLFDRNEYTKSVKLEDFELIREERSEVWDGMPVPKDAAISVVKGVMDEKLRKSILSKK